MSSRQMSVSHQLGCLCLASVLEAAEKQTSKDKKQRQNPESQPLPHAAAPIGSPPLEPPSWRSSRLSPDPLPLGWKSAVTAEGVTYYYNKGLNLSQFERPAMPATVESAVPSPPLAPPPRDASLHVGSAPSAFATPTAQMPQSMPATQPMQQSASSSNSVDMQTVMMLRDQHRAQMPHAGSDLLRAYHAAEIAKYEAMMYRGY